MKILPGISILNLATDGRSHPVELDLHHSFRRTLAVHFPDAPSVTQRSDESALNVPDDSQWAPVPKSFLDILPLSNVP